MIAVVSAFQAATSVNFDFTTAAVVSFVLMLLGLAAGFLLMLRFLNKNVDVEAK